MIDDSSSAPNIPWQAIMALMAGLGGVLYYYHGLESQRPAVAEMHPAEAVGYEDVQSRIWQDPFKAAEDYDAELSAKASDHPTATVNSAGIANINIASSDETNVDQNATHSLSVLQHEIKSVGSTTLILPVMVPNGPYAELAEDRLRTRAALLEALFVAGYRKDQEDHIGYVKLPWPERLSYSLPGSPPHALLVDVLLQDKPPGRLAKDNPDMKIDPLIVPYEWLARSRAPIHSHLSPAKFENILVLWLDEGAVGDFPLSRLAALVDAVSAPTASCQWKIMGPRTSTTLSNLVSNSSRLERRETKILDSVGFYSATASEEDAVLLRSLRQHTDPCETTAEYLKKQTGITLLRLGKTDRDLCECLATELRGRGLIDAEGGDSDIAVISEADTRYGRALPLTFAAAVSGESVNRLIDTPSLMPGWLYTFTYLRGLDGRTGEKASDEMEQLGSDPNAKGQAASKLAEPAESPQGQNQADYLRRLADQLVQLNNSLQKKGRRLQAIGLLGTDVYDKLLILQAIRDCLPKVLFFTTDLDAVYTLPAEWNAAHNLLIASSYGFRLHEYYQNGIPPFRDASQTATFTAALEATGAMDLPKMDRGNMAEVPRLFEISRFGALDITAGDFNLLDPNGESSEMEAPLKPATTIPPPPTLHPPRYDLGTPLGDHGLAFGEAIVCLAVLIAVPMFFGIRPPKFEVRELLRHSSLCIFAGVGFTLAFWLIWRRCPAGEPLALISGVSIWPSEALQIFAVALSFQLIWRSMVMRKNNDEELEDKLGLLPYGKESRRKLQNRPKNQPVEWMAGAGLLSVRPGLWLRQWRVFGDASGKWSRQYDLAAKLDPGIVVYAQNLWWEYQRHGQNRVRAIRVLLAVPFAVLLVICLHSFLGPQYNPARTAFARSCDRLFTIVAVSAFYFLCFWVLDVAYANVLFIRYLTKTKTQFHEIVIKQYLPAKDISDVLDFVDIRLIARRTKVVGEAVYYPFFVLSLLMIAKCSLFADWDWSPFVFTMSGTSIALAMVAPALLRATAETARKQSVQKIEVNRLKYVATGDDKNASFMASLGERVQNEREGAFSVLSQYPILGALLLPSGSVGLWAIVQYLPQLLR
jgi:hypothetical protein